MPNYPISANGGVGDKISSRRPSWLQVWDLAGGRCLRTGVSRAVPSLFRFLVMIGFLVGLVYATMFALVTFVDPQPREISVRVPADRLQP